MVCSSYWCLEIFPSFTCPHPTVSVQLAASSISTDHGPWGQGASAARCGPTQHPVLPGRLGVCLACSSLEVGFCPLGFIADYRLSWQPGRPGRYLFPSQPQVLYNLPPCRLLPLWVHLAPLRLEVFLFRNPSCQAS